MFQTNACFVHGPSDFQAGKNSYDSIEAAAIHNRIAVRPRHERGQIVPPFPTTYEVAGFIKPYFQPSSAHAFRQPLTRLQMQRREGAAGPGPLRISEAGQFLDPLPQATGVDVHQDAANSARIQRNNSDVRSARSVRRRSNPSLGRRVTSSMYSLRLISTCRLCRPRAGSPQRRTISTPL